MDIHDASEPYWGPKDRPPLAVQQAMAMGHGAEPDHADGGVQGHDPHESGIQEGQRGRTFVAGCAKLGAGLLGPASMPPASTKPSGLMDLAINEEMVHSYLKSTRKGGERGPTSGHGNRGGDERLNHECRFVGMDRLKIVSYSDVYRIGIHSH